MTVQRANMHGLQGIWLPAELHAADMIAALFCLTVLIEQLMLKTRGC